MQQHQYPQTRIVQVRQQVLKKNDTVARALRARFEAAGVYVVSLVSSPGAGKTAFVRGLAEGLGIDPGGVTSPTFTLVHEYRGGRLPLIHVDLYRLESADLDEIGLDGDLAVQGVVAVEWSERLSRRFPGSTTIQITDLGGDRRTIEVRRPSHRPSE